MRNLLGISIGLLALVGCDLLNKGGGDGHGSSPGSPNRYVEPGYQPPPVICEVQRCNEFSLRAETSSLERAHKALERLDRDAMLADVRSAFAERTPGAILLSHIAARAGARSVHIAQDETWADDATRDVSPGTADWLATALDSILEDAPHTAVPSPASEDGRPPLGVLSQPLETSGCGDMSVRIALGGVQVNERDDNFADDEIYCVVQARDDHAIELLHTEVTPPLGPGDWHTFEDAYFYGRDGGRDPGTGIEVTYDCYEQDSPAEYERIEETINQLTDIATKVTKVLGQGYHVVVAVSQAARLVVRIAALFDGDDYLYHQVERLDRQALWGLMSTPARQFAAAGRHLGSDWAWRFSVATTGCALGETAGAGSPSGGPGPSPQGCSSQTCAGCCVGGRCDPGDDEQACGSYGEACYSCQGLEACRDGACVFDGRRRVDVVALRAQVDERKPSGYCWDDIIGACDDPPDVRITLRSGGQGNSSELRRTWTPQWNATLLVGVEARYLLDGIEVVLQDDDFPSPDDDIGRCTLQPTVDDLMRGDVSFQCGSQAVVYLRFDVR